MQYALKLLAASTFAIGLAVPNAQARKNTYQVVALGRYTYAQAINTSGEVAGWYFSSKGFIREPDGTMTDFAVQDGCGDVIPWAINDSGVFVGWAFNGSGCSTLVGFLRAKDGTITTVSGLEGWHNTQLRSVDAKGTAVGVYEDAGGIQRAFVRSPEGILTQFAPLANVLTIDITSSGNGTIAGSYYDPDSDQYLGFLQNADGSLTTFGDPEHTGDFFHVAVNDNGWITGWYQISRQPGFIRRPSGKFTILKRGVSNSINSSEAVSGFQSKSAFVRSKNGEIMEVHMPVDKSFVEWTVLNDSRVLAGTFCEKDVCRFQEDDGFVAYPLQ